jgi:16S rRNA (uracil1498-N3)-methyltransferase
MSVYFYQPGIPDGKHFLEEEEANHCARVLRHKPGDIIQVMDGKGSHYSVQLTTATARQCDFSILETRNFPRDPYMVHLAISPTKNADRTEWMAEKCVELGIHKLTLLTCDHSERTRVRTDRVLKKMIAAMKQSMRAYAPELDAEVISMDDFIDKMQDKIRLCIAYVDMKNPPMHLKDIVMDKDTCILIGPEGDFSNRELEVARNHKIPSVSLGPYRLRTETAGVAAVHILQLLQQ